MSDNIKFVCRSEQPDLVAEGEVNDLRGRRFEKGALKLGLGSVIDFPGLAEVRVTFRGASLREAKKRARQQAESRPREDQSEKMSRVCRNLFCGLKYIRKLEPVPAR